MSAMSAMSGSEAMSIELLFLLAGAAAIAGVVDSIAGGGGLIALPALLWAGVSPVAALATNKLQGSFGTATATWSYHLAGQIDWWQLRYAIPLTFLGASLGTQAVMSLGTDLLSRLIPILLILCAVYFACSPRPAELGRAALLRPLAFASSIAPGIGFYDGFFGPGTGSFFALAFVVLAGQDLRRATASTKVLNLASNLAALTWFAYAGEVLLQVGLAMGIAQMVGAWCGSKLALRYGAVLIRRVLVIVSIATSLRLLLAT